MRKIFVFIISLLCFNFTFFAQQSYPKITINGQDFYEYTIEAGDGLYSISKKFGVNQTDLHNANSGLTTNIKAGQKILIPINKEVNTDNKRNCKTHLVEAKQTLYSISKLYNVSVDSLTSLNPGSENGIKIGQILYIPNINTNNSVVIKEANRDTITRITHIVKKKETLYSISKRYNIAIHDLISENPELENGLKAGATIIITPKNGINDKKKTEENDSKELDEIEKKNSKPIKLRNKERELKKKQKDNINDIVTQAMNGVHINFSDSILNDSIEAGKINKNLNIVYLLPLDHDNERELKSSERFIEFYRGSLLALYEAKNSGISVNVYTFSTGKSTEKVINLINELNKIDIDIIIGPAYSNQIDTIVSYAKQRNIISVIPFSSKISEIYYYPKLMQFNPPQNELFNSILENTFAPVKRKYVIGRFDGCSNKGNTFANELCRILNLNGVQYNEVVVTPNNINSVVKSFTTDSTLFLLASTSITDVAPVIDSLCTYRLPKVELWGFEEWGNNLIKKYPKTLFYSLFNPHPTDFYVELYQKWFGVYNKRNDGVKYDLIGYDLTLLTINDIVSENGELVYKPTEYNYYMQSNPNFQFINNRWVNTNYYLFLWNNTTINAIN